MGMNPLRLLRQPPRWLRAALAGVLLALVLDVLAHSHHGHEQDAHAGAGPECAYCAMFNGLMDAPAVMPAVFRPALAPAPQSPPGDIRVLLQPDTCAQPRAPPAPRVLS